MTSRDHPVPVERVRAALDEVVRVMKTIPAVWESREPVTTSASAQRSGATSVEQYLRWGKVPDVERILESDWPWPKDSSAGVRVAGMLSTHPHLAPLRAPLDALDALLVANGDPASYAYQLAWEAFQKRDDGACIAAARDALALDPNHRNAAHIAGWALLRKGDAALAIPLLERATELASRETDPIIHLCDALVATGRGVEAEERMERASAESATRMHAYNWLGWHFTRHTRDLPRAIASFEHALEGGRSWGVAWLNYGWALELAGRRDDAFVAYACALLAGDAYDVPWAEKKKTELGVAIRAENREPFDPVEWLAQSATFALVRAVRSLAERTGDPTALIVIENSIDVRYGSAAAPLERVADRLLARGDRDDARRVMASACSAYDATAQGLVHEAEGDDARADANRARKKLARM